MSLGKRTKRLIISASIGLVSEYYPIPGMILTPIHSTLKPYEIIFSIIVVNFLFVTGVIYIAWTLIAAFKEEMEEQRKNSD